MTSPDILTTIVAATDSKIVISTRTDNDGVSGTLSGYGGTFAVAQDGGPRNGTLTVVADGTFSYVPVVGWTGEDSFSFSVTDANGLSSTATVRISVAVDGPTTIEGTDGRDILIGGPDSSTIFGGEGDDVLHGRSYSAIHGGGGNDHLILDYPSGDSVYGGDGNDIIEARILFDSGWAPQYYGGSGDDLYLIGSSGQGFRLIFEDEDGGVDTVRTTRSLTLDANVENVQLLGDFAAGLTGNAQANHIAGNAATNILRGEAGDDTLLGWAGDDILDGGLGVDTLEGGTGNDLLIADGSDTVVEALDGGVDTIEQATAASLTLAANVENLTVKIGVSLSTSIGNALANTMTGNYRANTIFGEGGNDSLNGGSGDDVLHGGEGNDRIDGAYGSDTIHGGAGDDWLTNGFLLYGGAGNDTLSGGVSLVGGTGNDTYIGGTGAKIIELAGGGIDTVHVAGGNYTLSANVENAIVVRGSYDLTVTGNNLANVMTSRSGSQDRYQLNGAGGNDTLIGGAGQDILNGGTGADRMAGGSGSDRYAVDSTGDVVVEAYGAGTDLVKSSLSFTLVANVEHLTLSGLRAINGTGNWLNNNIYGNSAANILSGAGGHDYLDGAAGGDKLLGGSGNDALLGGSGGDQLFGGLGSDLVSGGLGNDVMHGGAGLDAFRFERGQDRIADFQVGLDELGFDDSLYGNRLISEDEVLGYGRISGGNAVFDFGNGNVLTLVGVSDLEDLRGYLYYF